MSPIPFFNRHPRTDLSAFIDGELSPRAVKSLESHLATCSQCAGEVASLRETRATLRSLPEAAAPRSFALTPEMARRPAPAPAATYGLKPVVNGLRLASGGLAA